MAQSRLAGPSGPVSDRTATQLIRTERPFTGYRPSLNPAFADLGTASSMSNLIIRNATLTWDHGWTKYHNSGTNPLPLGGLTVAFPGGAAGNPVAVLDYYDDNIGGGNEATVAVTANAAAGGPGTVFLYRHTAASNWAAATDINAIGFVTDETHVMDSCYYPYSYLTGAGALPRGHLFITNGVRDLANARIIFYPATTATNYATIGTPATVPNLSAAGAFGCRSLAAKWERVYAFNTVEGPLMLGVAESRRQPKRLRWTRPGWTAYLSTVWSSATGLGAGAQDLFQVGGEGVKVASIGTKLACYFDEGVVILSNTGNMRPHLSISSVSTSRGLLGTQALVDLGGGNHFGVFTDGFWFLNENGSWNEAGIATEGGLRYRKFTDAFFESLYKPNAYRIVCGFDQERRLITITWPTTASTFATWIYDIDLDEMYPQVYSSLTGITGSQQGHAFLVPTKGTGQLGRCYIHGTRSGHVWEHTPGLSTRNAENVAWSYTTHYLDGSAPWGTQAILEGWLDVYGHAAANAITWSRLGARTGTPLGSSVVMSTVAASKRDFLRFPIHVSETAIYHSVAGTHPTSIYGIGLRSQRTGEAP